MELYGHPFSSYTWKARIGLAALGFEPEFRVLDDEHPDHLAFVRANGGPWGLFPVLRDGAAVVFEATAILEYADALGAGTARLIPAEAGAAMRVRMLDRVFDNYVMHPMNEVVREHLRAPDAPDAARVTEARERLRRSYAWLERWLASDAPPPGAITLVECAAAPSLFYADWIEPIGDDCPQLAAWRAALLALPQVARFVDEARPYRGYFPPGAPDRD